MAVTAASEYRLVREVRLRPVPLWLSHLLFRLSPDVYQWRRLSRQEAVSMLDAVEDAVRHSPAVYRRHRSPLPEIYQVTRGEAGIRVSRGGHDAFVFRLQRRSVSAHGPIFL